MKIARNYSESDRNENIQMAGVTAKVIPVRLCNLSHDQVPPSSSSEFVSLDMLVVVVGM